MSKEKELLENILIKMNRIFDDYIALDDKYRRLLEQKSQSDRELVLKKEELQQAEERIKSLKWVKDYLYPAKNSRKWGIELTNI